MDKVQVRKTESIWEDLEKVRDRVMKRAYEIFKGNGETFGQDLDNWLDAERQLFWKPAIELEEKDGEFHLKVAAPGIDAKDLQVEVSAEDLVIKGESKREKKEEKGEIYTSEISSGSLFRSIHFPKKVDPEKVKAEFKNGMLNVTAAIAEKAEIKKIPVAAA